MNWRSYVILIIAVRFFETQCSIFSPGGGEGLWGSSYSIPANYLPLSVSYLAPTDCIWSTETQTSAYSKWCYQTQTVLLYVRIQTTTEIADCRSVISPVNPLECRGNYSATSNDMKLTHWPLMGGLLHLVQRGADWAGTQPSLYTKCNSPPINGQCINHRIAIQWSVALQFQCAHKGLSNRPANISIKVHIIPTRDHSESANLCQSRNLTVDSFSPGKRPWYVLQGHRGWRRWTERNRLPISVL